MKGYRAAMITAVAAVAMIVVSCSTAPPEIAQTFWQLNLVRNPAAGGVRERLSLFLHVIDGEGVSDLSSIYLLNDASELYWRLDSSNWQSSDANGELWVGSNHIETAGGSPLPRGKYRILLSNLAGERVASEIFVPSEEIDPALAPFPTLAISGKVVKVTSRFKETSLWLYNDVGGLVASYRGGEVEVPLASLLPRAAPVVNGSLYAYAYDQACGCGLIDGPYAVDFRR